jgi:peroxiredoxin family protein
MKVGIVIYSGDAETVWNAFRFGNFALSEGDQVKVFLLAKGVEAESLDNDKFKVTEMMKTFVNRAARFLRAAHVSSFAIQMVASCVRRPPCRTCITSLKSRTGW